MASRAVPDGGLIPSRRLPVSDEFVVTRMFLILVAEMFAALAIELLKLSRSEARAVASPDTVIANDRVTVSSVVGANDGVGLGNGEGPEVGTKEGDGVGSGVGSLVGAGMGFRDGSGEGLLVGEGTGCSDG